MSITNPEYLSLQLEVLSCSWHLGTNKSSYHSLSSLARPADSSCHSSPSVRDLLEQKGYL